MKLDFVPQRAMDDESRHEYCVHCHAESVEWIVDGDRKRCWCRTCLRVTNRAVILDPEIAWWKDGAGEYWHETAGVFVRDPSARFLFFDRTAFPFALTIPAGHVERNERPDLAAERELSEETGISAAALRAVTRTPIIGDECRRGADAHIWHAYLLTVPEGTEPNLGSEGHSPVWLTLNEASSRLITFAVRSLIERYEDELVENEAV